VCLKISFNRQIVVDLEKTGEAKTVGLYLGGPNNGRNAAMVSSPKSGLTK
jgi:hypothetical protein